MCVNLLHVLDLWLTWFSSMLTYNYIHLLSTENHKTHSRNSASFLHSILFCDFDVSFYIFTLVLLIVVIITFINIFIVFRSCTDLYVILNFYYIFVFLTFKKQILASFLFEEDIQIFPLGQM